MCISICGVGENRMKGCGLTRDHRFCRILHVNLDSPDKKREWKAVSQLQGELLVKRREEPSSHVLE